MTPPVLDVRGLRVRIPVGRREITPVDGVSLRVGRGEAVGVAGESGSGKSLTLKAIMGLLPPGARADGDLLVSLDGSDPHAYDPERVRGHGIAMIFQEPLTALNPTMRVGDFVAEGLRIHRRLGRREAWHRAVALMREVGFPDAARRARAWPHQLSGGLQQRVTIAAALSGEPQILLCDEPTTALDVTIQDQILGLLKRLAAQREMALVFVTHDLAVIGEVCERVIVMYAGQVVEKGFVDDVFAEPRHPYTAALLASVPSLGSRADRLEGIGGRPPDPRGFPNGCRFAPRCRFARDDCRVADYALRNTNGRGTTACIHPEVLKERVG
jgi:oligopeptide/dipeptide ABC transporter ATP-binding protein